MAENYLHEEDYDDLEAIEDEALNFEDQEYYSNEDNLVIAPSGNGDLPYESDQDPEDMPSPGDLTPGGSPLSDSFSDSCGTDISYQSPIGLSGTRSQWRHTNRYIKDVLRAASDTYESEELGRLTALLTLRAGMGRRKSLRLISSTCGRLLDAALLTSYYDNGGARFSAAQIVEMCERCAGGSFADKDALMLAMADLVESKILSPEDEEAVQEFTNVGLDSWLWSERRQYCALLCEACDTKRQCATILAAFTVGITPAEELELVQDIIQRDFFLDLKGRVEEIWIALPHIKNQLDLPSQNDGQYDFDDGFLVDEEETPSEHSDVSLARDNNDPPENVGFPEVRNSDNNPNRSSDHSGVGNSNSNSESEDELFAESEIVPPRKRGRLMFSPESDSSSVEDDNA